MANGPYGVEQPAIGIVTKVTATAVPVGKVRTVNIGINNTTNTDAFYSIAYSAAANAAGIDPKEWKRTNFPLPAYREHQRTGEPLGAGENVWVMTTVLGVNFDVRGFEGAA